MPLGQKAWVPGQEGLQPGIPSSPGRSRSFVHGDLADEESDLMEPWEAGSAGRTCCSLTSPRSVRAGCLLLSTAQDVLGAAVFKCVCVCVHTCARALRGHGQFCGSLSAPLCGFWGSAEVVSLSCKPFYLLSHFSSLCKIIFFELR